MGGGVGGLLYAENADNSGLNYKHYNLRGDIVATTDSECSILVQYLYEAFGAIIETYGISPSDRYRSNTKYRDGYINEGRRWRTTSATGFISPDPLEYIDGLNCYIYCGNNPWGRFDPYGLAELNPMKCTYSSGPIYHTFNDNVGEIISIWAKSLGSSDINFAKEKKYFIAQESNFTIVNSDGSKISKSVVVIREAKIHNGEMYSQEVKEILQDEFNDAGIDKDKVDSITVESSFRIYEGEIPSKLKKSDVICADSEVSIYGTKTQLNDGKNFNDVTSYSMSQVGNESPYVSDAKNLDEFEKENNVKSIDISNKVRTTIDIKNKKLKSEKVK